MMDRQGKIKSCPEIQNEGENIPWLLYDQKVSQLNEQKAKEGGQLREQTAFE